MDNIERLNRQLTNTCKIKGKIDFEPLSWPVFPVIMTFYGQDIPTWHLLKTSTKENPPRNFTGFPFSRWQEIAQHAKAITNSNRDINLWIDNRFKTLQSGFNFRSYKSAGLATFLAVMGEIIGIEYIKGVAATGVLAPILHPRNPVKVRKVDYLAEKLKMLIEQASCLEITKILYPAENKEDLSTELLSVKDVELIPITDTLDAAKKIFGDTVELNTLKLSEIARVIEAVRFFEPYNRQRQELVIDTARDLLVKIKTKSYPGDNVDEIITKTILGHYYIHQGKTILAKNIIDDCMEKARKLWEEQDPWLDATRYARLLNITAVLYNDLMQPEDAVKYCDIGIKVMNNRGEEYIHLLGTMIQAQTRLALMYRVLKNDKWKSVIDQAIKIGERLIQISYMDPRHVLYLANALSIRMDFGRAEALLNRIRYDKTTDKRFYLLGLANLYFRQNRYDDWLVEFDRLYQDNTRLDNRVWPDKGILMAKLIALNATGQFDKASKIKGLAECTDNQITSIRLLWGLVLLNTLSFSKNKESVISEITEMFKEILDKNHWLNQFIKDISDPTACKDLSQLLIF